MAPCPYCKNRTPGSHLSNCPNRYAVSPETWARERAEYLKENPLPEKVKPLYFNGNGFLQGDLDAPGAMKSLKQLLEGSK